MKRTRLAAAALLASVSGAALADNIGNTTFFRVDITPPVKNSSYTSGQDIGGLVALALPRSTSGILQSLSVQFIGGATTAITAYCFDKQPAVLTGFVDQGTFSIDAGDEASRINKLGITVTPTTTTGETPSTGSLDNYAKPFKATGTIWCGFVAGGTFTPASVTDMRVSITGFQTAP